MERVYRNWLATVMALTLVAGYIAFTLWSRYSQDVVGHAPISIQMGLEKDAECGRIPPVNTQERAVCYARIEPATQQLLPGSLPDVRSIAAKLDR